ncbi:MAG: hypothetical protein E7069_03675 [Bacteroidales bacterium]|nr:hypothetical protein [Bacteroidales bacterium]
MKRSFQIFRNIIAKGIIESTDSETNKVTAGGNIVSLTDQLRQDFTKCVGVFVVPQSASTDLSGVTCSLKIAQNEILPDGFDLSLIAFKGEVSLGQTIYDFSKDEIPAKSSEFEMILTNNTKTDQMFNLYFVLER